MNLPFSAESFFLPSQNQKKRPENSQPYLFLAAIYPLILPKNDKCATQPRVSLKPGTQNKKLMEHIRELEAEIDQLQSQLEDLPTVFSTEGFGGWLNGWGYMYHEGFGWDPLLKMVHNPGGDWNPGRGDNPNHTILDDFWCILYYILINNKCIGISNMLYIYSLLEFHWFGNPKFFQVFSFDAPVELCRKPV